MATVVKCFAIQGVDGYVVDAETKILDGQPMISIIGMGDQAVKEAGERDYCDGISQFNKCDSLFRR